MTEISIVGATAPDKRRGKPMQLRARWEGTPPLVGDYLMSTVRPKFAYRVLHVEYDTIETVTANHETTIAVRKLRLDVEQVSLHSVPEDATVHAWKWDKR